MARDLLRRWWGLEMGLSDAKGGGYDRTSHATCESVRGIAGPACAKELADLAAQFTRTKERGAIVKTCHAGMTIVAAPVLGIAGLLGIVFATGGHDVDASAAEHGLIKTIGSTPDEARILIAATPVVSAEHQLQIKDLVAAAAAAVERALPIEIPTTAFSHPFNEIVGDAPAVRDVVKLLAKVVKSEATVLVHGESGTGKELIARAIHYHGPRAKKPFVVQNCSAFNDNLLESALFGHVRGAFTGAVKDQPGLFQVADGGTFFLDEIGDMTPALQVKVLRVLQEGTFMPVGATEQRKVDVRILAATNRDLRKMVEDTTFREDLYYRVNVINITVPALRKRKEDIPMLMTFTR